MAGKILILAGAPDSSSLSWDPSILLSHIQNPIARFARLSPSSTPSHEQASTPSLVEEYAVWRSLPLEREKLHTGLTQQHGFNISQNTSPEFLTTASFSFISNDGSQMDDETNQLMTQFYEQSLAIHEQIPSSQLLASQSEIDTQGTTSFLDGTTTSFSFQDTTSYSEDEGTKEPLGNIHSHPTNLKDIPSASYILTAQPATVTVNLIVGIISLSPPRTIKTRWGSTSSLVEVLVGDETKSGFAITFWIPNNINDSPLAGLRPQDVVLLQNVALNVFMKKVYGSSLRKDMTKVHLLYRRKLDRGDQGGYYSARDLGAGNGNPQLDKTRRVREWVLNFVGTGSGTGGGGKGRGGKGKAPVRPWDMPPPDTQ